MRCTKSIELTWSNREDILSIMLMLALSSTVCVGVSVLHAESVSKPLAFSGIMQLVYVEKYPDKQMRQCLVPLDRNNNVILYAVVLFSTITLAILTQFFIVFAPLETRMNSPQSHVIYLLNSLMTL